jgi:hypothetical protein
MLLLSDLFIIRSEVTVKSVIIREEMRGCGVRVIQQSIVHVFVVRADPLPQPHLFDPLSVLLPGTLLPRSRLNIVIRIIELCRVVLLLLLLLLHLSIGVIILLLHSQRVLLLLHHF